MDQKLLALIRRRDKAESRFSNASGSVDRYNSPTVHRYERDVAEELIQDRLEELKLKKSVSKIQPDSAGEGDQQ